jgi:hypothetical protein
MKIYHKIRIYCNENHGFVLVLCTLAILLIAPIFNFQQIAKGIANPNLMRAILTLVSYPLQVPLYVFALLIFLFLVGNSWSKKNKLKKFLVGSWTNNWGAPPAVGSGSEPCSIDNRFRYFVGGNHRFDLKQLKFRDGEITFVKTRVTGRKEGVYFNKIRVMPNDSLAGQETRLNDSTTYPISYGKVSI